MLLPMPTAPHTPHLLQVGLAVALMEAGAIKGSAAWYCDDGSLDSELAPPLAKAMIS